MRYIKGLTKDTLKLLKRIHKLSTIKKLKEN
jgi:hypothetical protein